MKFYVCIFGALFWASSVLAFPTPSKHVPSQCIDPTFACQDLETARLCDVVKSCVHDIWATMSAPDDNDEICDICKEMVKEARDQLLSNMTQEEIKEVFEGSCKLLPVKLIADACIKIVDEIIPELVEMLASRMDPNMVCTVSGLCNMAHLPVENQILKFLRITLTKKDDQCAECTKMVVDIQTFLNSTAESDVKTYIEKFCDEKIPSYLCDLVVSTYFPQLYSYIKSTDAKTLCGSVGICPKMCKLKEENPEIKDELTCEFCEHVLEHIKQMVIANTTVEEFKTALLNFCKHMRTFSDKCTSLVDDYYDMLFDYIRTLDTKGMCTLMGLCDNQSCSKTPFVKLFPAVEAKRRIPLIRLEPAERVMKQTQNVIPLVRLVPSEVLTKKQMVESNDIFQNPGLQVDKFVHPLPLFEQDTECAFCKAITFYLEHDLNGDSSKDGVRNALNGVCDKWVKDFPDHCHQFLNKYSLKIEHSIAKGTELKNVCSESKACAVADKATELNVKVLPKAEGSPFCDLCKDAMTEVENQLSDPATKEKLKNLFDQACNVLPKSLKDDCVNFVNQNVDALIDILEQELKPDNVCPALGLCPASLRLGVSQRVKDLECDVCKDVVSNLREKLSDPGSKKVVLTFLEEGCARLPGSLAQECKTFVDENIDTIMGMIIQELDPDTFCSILKICPGTFKVKPKKVNNLECDLCKEVVEKVEDLIKDKKTEDEIKDALDKVCSYMPKSIATKCENFVNQYTDLLITLLAEEMDPSMVCAALNVCPANETYAEWEAKAQDLECQGCQYALHFVQEQLMNSETQAEVKNVLKKFCDVLPATYAKNCEAFVDEYGDSLLVLVAQEIDPSTMCFELKFCGKQAKLFKKTETDILHPFKIDECSVCTTVVDYLDKLLEEDDVDKEITKLVEKVCTVLPSAYKDRCASMLETYGPYILQMIGQVADSREVCQEVDLCSRTPGHVHLVGGNKCTFGPSYWCRSKAHASACKAEMFCKQRVWKN